MNTPALVTVAVLCGCAAAALLTACFYLLGLALTYIDQRWNR